MRQYVVFAAVLVTFVYLMHSIDWPAQDWIPYQVAGQLWLRGEAVYANGHEFTRLSCVWYQNSPECLRGATPFVATPLSLPMAALGVSAVFVRLVGAACLTYATYRLRLGWETLLLVPAGIHCLLVGQTAPLLIAAAVAPMWWSGCLLGLCVAFKASPVLLLLPLLIHRRSADLISFAVTVFGLQAVCWLLQTPDSGWVDWSAYMHELCLKVNDVHANIAAPQVVRLGVAGLLVIGLIRTRRDYQASWWLTWAAWPLLIPLVWWYYAWVTVGAVASARLPRWVTVIIVFGTALCSRNMLLPRDQQWIWEAFCFGLAFWAFALRDSQTAVSEPLNVDQRDHVDELAAK